MIITLCCERVELGLSHLIHIDSLVEGILTDWQRGYQLTVCDIGYLEIVWKQLIQNVWYRGFLQNVWPGRYLETVSHGTHTDTLAQ